MDEKLRATKIARVLETAPAVFLRRGYSYTTMGDLSNAACMSRPALYLLFPDKQSIFSSILPEFGRLPSGRFLRTNTANELTRWVCELAKLWIGRVDGRTLEDVVNDCDGRHKRTINDLSEKDFLEGLLLVKLRDSALQLPSSADAQLMAQLIALCVIALSRSSFNLGARKALVFTLVSALLLATSPIRSAVLVGAGDSSEPKKSHSARGAF